MTEHDQGEAKAKADALVTPAPPKKSMMPAVLAVLVVVFLVSLAWCLGKTSNPGPALDEKVLVFGAKAELEMTRIAVNEFRTKTGFLPEALEDATHRHAGVAYKALGKDDYELSVQTAGQTITLKGSDDIEAFYGSK
jgi:hypothetical protein